MSEENEGAEGVDGELEDEDGPPTSGGLQLRSDEGADEMGGDELEEFEKSDSVTGMSAADKKKHQMEYMQLLKEIEGQNQIVEQLKDALIDACGSPCLTKCELKEIKHLRGCMENENLKLQCMVQKAMQMQNENPSRNWAEIPIVVSLEDDVFPRMGNTGVMASLGLVPRGSEDRGDVCNVCSKRNKKKASPCQTQPDEFSSETTKMFEEMNLKDKMICCLNEKIKSLEQELCCIERQKKKASKHDRSGMQYLDNNISSMQRDMDCLKNDFQSFCDERNALERQKCKKPMGASEPCSKKQNELKQMKEDYAQLLVNFAKKDEQLVELEKRVKGYCGGGGGSNAKPDVDQAELKLLREKVSDLRDEQEEYTCIIKEQSDQIEDYRKKYIDAQQKVEEQKCMLEKIDMNNKRIEGQIEAEVKRIKAKFKEQLSELSQYPKLLENEQIKLATTCKEKDDLEAKLRLICKELKSVKESVASQKDTPDLSQKVAKYEFEIESLQTKNVDLQKEKEIVCEELHRAKLDLDTMRGESAKIITSTKERFEINKNTMCLRIDVLEKELAQCRANAYLSVTDREAVIKEMQSQLSTLSYSFDSAQKQIKTLKNHITFLSNDQCIPIKC